MVYMYMYIELTALQLGRARVYPEPITNGVLEPLHGGNGKTGHCEAKVNRAAFSDGC